MKEIHYSTKAKKDLKKYKNNHQKLEALFTVLDIIAKGQKVPAKYKPHKLQGTFNMCWECHIENDFLLIWIDEKNNLIEVVRIGTHSELFNK